MAKVIIGGIATNVELAVTNGWVLQTAWLRGDVILAVAISEVTDETLELEIKKVGKRHTLTKWKIGGKVQGQFIQNLYSSVSGQISEALARI